MRIKSLSLSNFRNHEHLSLAFEDRTLIVGPNGSGKSSIIDAIAWALTGRCRGVNARGEGQRDLIRDGAKEMSVTVDVDGVGPVTRSIGRTGSSTGVKPEIVLGKLGTTDGMLHAVLYGQTFFDLHHADAKSMLMGALNVKVQPGDLCVAGKPIVDAPVDLDYLEALYQAAFQSRAAVKRQLAAFVLPAMPDSGDGAPAAADVSEDDVKAARQAVDKAMRARAAAEAKLKTTESEIERLTRLADVGPVTGAKAAHETEHARHVAQLDAARVKLSEAEAMPAEPSAALEVQAREAEVLVEKLRRHDPDRGCVLAPAIPCLTRAEEFAGQIDRLGRDVKALADRIKAGRARDLAIRAAEQSIKEAEGHVRYHAGQIEDCARRLAEAEQAAADLKTLRADRAAAKRTATDAQNSYASAQAEYDRAVEGYRVGIQAAAIREAYDRAVNERAAIQAEVDRLEETVELLGPKGVRVDALRRALDGFHDAINAALEPFGFSLSIQVDPWRVVVSTGDASGIRFEMLSKGQRLWTGLAFQIALATVSGLDFLSIDDTEAVVGDDRRTLTANVMTADTGQILIAMAKAADEATGNIQGVQVVRLGAGVPAVL